MLILYVSRILYHGPNKKTRPRLRVMYVSYNSLLDSNGVGSGLDDEFVPGKGLVLVGVDAVESLSDGGHIGSSKVFGHELLLLEDLGSPFLSGDLSIGVLVESVKELLELGLSFGGLQGLGELLGGGIGLDFRMEFIPGQLVVAIAVDSVESFTPC